LNQEALIFNETVLSEGFTYDSMTGTFTALNPGVYHFSIRVDVDDGNTGAVPRVSYIEFAGVQRPSDSLMQCHVPAGGREYPCTATFIMVFDSANQPFTLTNVDGDTAYYGYYDGNPFTKSLEMSVFQLE
jgi:hypothetical protein